MRKVLGWLVSVVGLGMTAVFVFFGFDGKYGFRQFMSSLEDFDLDPSVVPFVLIGVGVLTLGLWLALGKKKASSGG